jgi:hypothetical protein
MAGVSTWTTRVAAPFRDDPRFWASVGRSADALVTLVIATVLVAVFGGYAAVAFVIPVVLLVMGGRDARVSTARTRPLFATRGEWRAAERQAVAAAIPGALLRHLRR